MNKSIKSAQSGFTLIELIVVIVILGILAATALPKFANLGGDARLAGLNAAKGSLSATSAMVHGMVLVSQGTPASVTVEGQAVAVTNGYPTAGNQLVAAAGLAPADYTVVLPNTAATDNLPGTGAGDIAIVPASLAGKPAGLNCFVRYTQAAAANAAPTITLGVNGTLAPAACE